MSDKSQDKEKRILDKMSALNIHRGKKTEMHTYSNFYLYVWKTLKNKIEIFLQMTTSVFFSIVVVVVVDVCSSSSSSSSSNKTHTLIN